MQRLLILTLLFISLNSYSQSFLDFYFKSKNVDGGIIIYNEKKGSWYFNNERDNKKKSPIGSFFHLTNSLIALDLGLITPKPNEYIPWDGVKRYYFGTSFTNWNCNTNLDEALLFKTDWYFQRVSEMIKQKDYDYFLKRLQFSDLKYNSKEKYFWHFGGLETTPEEQLEFLKNLNNQSFFFRKENQTYILDNMLMLKEDNYAIYGYETFNVFEGNRIDWWIGILKTKDNTYYFSTRIYEDVNEQQSAEFFTKKFQITIEIFRVLGYI